MTILSSFALNRDYLFRSRYLQNNIGGFFSCTFSLDSFSCCRTNDDLCSRRCKRTHQLIQGNIRRRLFNFCYAGLAGFQLNAKLFLGHIDRLSLLTNCLSERETCVKQLALFRTHTQEICGITNLPASSFNCFTLSCIHQITFHLGLLLLFLRDRPYGVIILLQSLLASIDHFLRNLLCFLGVNLYDQNRIRVNSIHDPPILFRIPNSECSTSCSDYRQGFRLRHGQLHSPLERSEKHSSLLPSLRCERRRLNFAVKPNQIRVDVSSLFRFGHDACVPCFSFKVYIGCGISSSEKNGGNFGIFTTKLQPSGNSIDRIQR